MYQIQSIIFDREKWTLDEAKDWILDNEFDIIKMPHLTDRFIRFRQKEPNYKKYNYITKKLKDGIEFIIGYPK